MQSRMEEDKFDKFLAKLDQRFQAQLKAQQKMYLEQRAERQRIFQEQRKDREDRFVAQQQLRQREFQERLKRQEQRFPLARIQKLEQKQKVGIFERWFAIIWVCIIVLVVIFAMYQTYPNEFSVILTASILTGLAVIKTVFDQTKALVKAYYD